MATYKRYYQYIPMHIDIIPSYNIEIIGLLECEYTIIQRKLETNLYFNIETLPLDSISKDIYFNIDIQHEKYTKDFPIELSYNPKEYSSYLLYGTLDIYKKYYTSENDIFEMNLEYLPGNIINNDLLEISFDLKRMIGTLLIDSSLNYEKEYISNDYIESILEYNPSEYISDLNDSLCITLELIDNTTSITYFPISIDDYTEADINSINIESDLEYNTSNYSKNLLYIELDLQYDKIESIDCIESSLILEESEYTSNNLLSSTLDYRKSNYNKEILYGYCNLEYTDIENIDLPIEFDLISENITNTDLLDMDITMRKLEYRMWFLYTTLRYDKEYIDIDLPTMLNIPKNIYHNDILNMIIDYNKEYLEKYTLEMKLDIDKNYYVSEQDIFTIDLDYNESNIENIDLPIEFDLKPYDMISDIVFRFNVIKRELIYSVFMRIDVPRRIKRDIYMNLLVDNTQIVINDLECELELDVIKYNDYILSHKQEFDEYYDDLLEKSTHHIDRYVWPPNHNFTDTTLNNDIIITKPSYPPNIMECEINLEPNVGVDLPCELEIESIYTRREIDFNMETLAYTELDIPISIDIIEESKEYSEDLLCITFTYGDYLYTDIPMIIETNQPIRPIIHTNIKDSHHIIYDSRIVIAVSPTWHYDAFVFKNCLVTFLDKYYNRNHRFNFVFGGNPRADYDIINLCLNYRIPKKALHPVRIHFDFKDPGNNQYNINHFIDHMFRFEPHENPYISRVFLFIPQPLFYYNDPLAKITQICKSLNISCVGINDGGEYFEITDLDRIKDQISNNAEIDRQNRFLANHSYTIINHTEKDPNQIVY